MPPWSTKLITLVIFIAAVALSTLVWAELLHAVRPTLVGLSVVGIAILLLAVIPLSTEERAPQGAYASNAREIWKVALAHHKEQGEPDGEPADHPVAWTAPDPTPRRRGERRRGKKKKPKYRGAKRKAVGKRDNAGRKPRRKGNKGKGGRGSAPAGGKDPQTEKAGAAAGPGASPPLTRVVNLLCNNVWGFNAVGKAANLECYKATQEAEFDLLGLTETKLTGADTIDTIVGHTSHGANQTVTKVPGQGCGGAWWAWPTDHSDLTITPIKNMPRDASKGRKKFQSLAWVKISSPAWERDIVACSMYMEWGGHTSGEKLVAHRAKGIKMLDRGLDHLKEHRTLKEAVVVLTGDFNTHLGNFQIRDSKADLPRRSPCKEDTVGCPKKTADAFKDVLEKHHLTILNHTKRSEQHGNGFTRSGKVGKNQADTVIDYVCVSELAALGHMPGVSIQHRIDDRVDAAGKMPMNSDHFPQHVAITMTLKAEGPKEAQVPEKKSTTWSWGIKEMHPSGWKEFARATDAACRDMMGPYREALEEHGAAIKLPPPNSGDPAGDQRHRKAGLRPTLDGLGVVVTDMLCRAMHLHFEPSRGKGKEVSPDRSKGRKSVPWWNKELEAEKAALNATRRQYRRRRTAEREAGQVAGGAGAPGGEEQAQEPSAEMKQALDLLRAAESSFRKAFGKERAMHLGDYIRKAEAKSDEGDVKGFWRAIKRMATTYEGKLSVTNMLDVDRKATADLSKAVAGAARLGADVAAGPTARPGSYRYDQAKFDHDIKGPVERFNAAQAMHYLGGTLDECEGQVRNSPLHRPFTAKELKAVCGSLKNGRAAGDDRILNEMIKYSGEQARGWVLKLANKCWEAETHPTSWRQGRVSCIYKNKGLQQDWNNYRYIVVTSALAKVYEKLVDRRIRSILDSGGAHTWAETQGGFRHKRGCPEQVWLLRQLIADRFQQQRPGKAPGKPLYVAFVDLWKAFPSANRNSVLHLMTEVDLKGRLWRVVRDMGLGLTNYITFAGVRSEPYKVTQGLREGSVLSPTLFLVVIDPLIKLLEERGLGSVLKTPDGETHWLGALCFADDIALCADSPEQLQQMLDVLSEFARDYQLLPSPTKSEVMVFARTEPQHRHAARLVNTEPMAQARGQKVLRVVPMSAEQATRLCAGHSWTDEGGVQHTVQGAAESTGPNGEQRTLFHMAPRPGGEQPQPPPVSTARLLSGLTAQLPDDVMDVGGRMCGTLSGLVKGERFPGGAGEGQVEYKIGWQQHSSIAHDLVQWADWATIVPWREGEHALPPMAWTMWGEPLEEVWQFKYLGVWFQRYLNETVHCAKMESKAKMRAVMLMNMVGHSEGFGLAMNHVIRLYEAHVLSAATYGMEFCPNQGPETMDKINRHMCRWLCKAYRKYTPRQNLTLELGLVNGTAMVWRRHMVLQGILQRMNPARIQHGIHRQMREQIDTSDGYQYRSNGGRVRHDMSWEQAAHGLCLRLLPPAAAPVAIEMMRWSELSTDRDCDEWNSLMELMDNQLNGYSTDTGGQAYHWSLEADATSAAWDKAGKAQFSRMCAYMAKLCTIWQAEAECEAGSRRADYMAHFGDWGGWYVTGSGPQPYLCNAQRLSRTRQIFNLRTASSVLRAHKRGVNTDCPFCEGESETAFHFLAACPKYRTVRGRHEPRLQQCWDDLVASTKGDFVIDEMREGDLYSGSWSELVKHPQQAVKVLLGHPPLTADRVPRETLMTWLQEGTSRDLWNSFLRSSNMMMCHMLRVRREGMIALMVADAEPSSGEEEAAVEAALE